jgi:hypothetical protein
MITQRPSGDIDQVLRDYYRAEMPEPFPACPTPRPLVERRRWFNATRWAVAASVGLLLAAYLALAGFFPRGTSRLEHDSTRNIGQKTVAPAPK